MKDRKGKKQGFCMDKVKNGDVLAFDLSPDDFGSFDAAVSSQSHLVRFSWTMLLLRQLVVLLFISGWKMGLEPTTFRSTI